MARAGHVAIAPDGQDRRSRLVTMTRSGRRVWLVRAQPKIHDFYEQALAGFSVNDIAHTLHYLLMMLENMKRLDTGVDPAEAFRTAGSSTPAHWR
jgi:DNA-binding MarR family transcriptional regulator